MNHKKLFWVTTRDHDEDWFVIAPSDKKATHFHENYEGYDDGDALAKEVLTINKVYERKVVYHAQIEMLADMGFSIISIWPRRIVKKDNIIYQEGSCLQNVYKYAAYKTEGLYIIRMAGTNYYKIGITRNLSKRLKALQSGNPFLIEVYTFYPQNYSRIYERKAHEYYRNKKCVGEWFKLDLIDLSHIDVIMKRDNKVSVAELYEHFS